MIIFFYVLADFGIIGLYSDFGCSIYQYHVDYWSILDIFKFTGIGQR